MGRRIDVERVANKFNAHYPIGTWVTFWTGVREGPGRRGQTRCEAYVLGGHTAVVQITGMRGAIALTHVQPPEKRNP